MFGITYKRVGGIHWVSFGDFRFSFCKVSPATKRAKAAKAVARMWAESPRA